MPTDESGQRWACYTCIHGHRAQICQHYDRWMLAVKKPGRPSKCQHPDKICDCESSRMVLTVAIPREKPCQCRTDKEKKKYKNKECTCAKCSCFYETRVDKEAMDKAPKVDPLILQQRNAIHEACQLVERNRASCCNSGGTEGSHNPHPLTQDHLQSPVPLYSPQDEHAQPTSNDHAIPGANIGQVDPFSSSSDSSMLTHNARGSHGSISISNVQSVNDVQSAVSQPLAMPTMGYGSYSQSPGVPNRMSETCFGYTQPRPYNSTNNMSLYHQPPEQLDPARYVPGQIRLPDHNVSYDAVKDHMASGELWSMNTSNFLHPQIIQNNMPPKLGTRDHPLTPAHQQLLQNDPNFYQEVPQFASQGVVGTAALPAEDDPTHLWTERQDPHVCSCGPGCRCAFCITHPYNESSQRQVAEASRTLVADNYSHVTTSPNSHRNDLNLTIDPQILGVSPTLIENQENEFRQPQYISSRAPPLSHQEWDKQILASADESAPLKQTMDSSNYYHVQYIDHGTEPGRPPEHLYVNSPH